MKTRTSHVSNSSTSSFFGIGFQTDDETRIKEKYLTEAIRNEQEDGDFGEAVDMLIPWRVKEDTPEISKRLLESKVQTATIDYEGTYVYVSYTDMKDEETKAEFIQRVANLLTEVFAIPESRIGHVDYAWYNG